MQDFLKVNGITAQARYNRAGSMRGTWYFWNMDLDWSVELWKKLNAPVFTSFSGTPLAKYSNNGGTFSVSVRGHREIIEQANTETARALGFEKRDATAIRESAGVKESRDCTVRATAAALGISYAEARAKLAAVGRKNRRGVPYKEVYKQLGLQSHRRWNKGCPVGKVLPTLPTNGRFVVRVSRHVFAVVGGKVIDDSVPNPAQRVKEVYKVEIKEYPLAETCHFFQSTVTA
jgi:hypothetical protein